jgi:hypothetical protein
MSEVLKLLTPDADIRCWLGSDRSWLYVEMEDRETRALAGVRLDRDAAIVLLSQLTSLCEEVGWLKE